MLSYKLAVEARAVNTFWESRKAGSLRSRPEGLAQSLLEIFLKGIFHEKNSGLVLSELESGIGFIDVGVLLSRTLHIIELKVITNSVKGASQLDKYMKNESRNEGWLVLIDTRPPHRKTSIPPQMKTAHGIVKTIVVDVNPTAPSKT